MSYRNSRSKIKYNGKTPLRIFFTRDALRNWHEIFNWVWEDRPAVPLRVLSPEKTIELCRPIEANSNRNYYYGITLSIGN